MLIFEIEKKSKYKAITVYGVEIPLFGEFTVDEAIAVDRATESEIDHSLPSSSIDYMIVKISAWLPLRLNLVEQEMVSQAKKLAVEKAEDLAKKDQQFDMKLLELAARGSIDINAVRLKVKQDFEQQIRQSVAVIKALWTVYYSEEVGNTIDYEIDEPVTEGKDEDPTVPSLTSTENGIKSTSSSPPANSQASSKKTLVAPALV